MTQNNSPKKEKGSWNPPDIVSRKECIKSTQTVLALPDIKIKQYEDIFRIRALEMDWDIGAMIYEPVGSSKISLGADREKIGIYTPSAPKL